MTSPEPNPRHTARVERVLWSAFESQDVGLRDRVGKLLCGMARRGDTNPLGLFHGHPLEDDWRDWAAACVREHLRKRRGIVYVAANTVTAASGFYKIGVTSVDVGRRMRSLRSAGVVGEFLAVDEAFALDRFAAESRAHRSMQQRSTVRDREFFVTDYKTASDVMRECVKFDNEALSRAFPYVTETLDVGSSGGDQ